MEDPLAGPPVTVRYEVASGGRAVIEHQNPSGSLPSVTVYFLASGKLRAVQYSPAGNQPAYKLGGESTADLVHFDFDGGSGFDADHDGHVHKGELRFVAPDRIEQRWFHYVGPKEQGVTHWFLARTPPAPEEPKSRTPPPAPADKKRYEGDAPFQRILKGCVPFSSRCTSWTGRGRSPRGISSRSRRA